MIGELFSGPERKCIEAAIQQMKSLLARPTIKKLLR